MALNYEPWIIALPASLTQCAVCGMHGVETFQFQIHGPIPSESSCPACGFEFGGNSFMDGISFEEYRSSWTARGCPWWSTWRSAPVEWNAAQNLIDLTEGVRRAAFTPFSDRVPLLYEYYLKSEQVSKDRLADHTERAALSHAMNLLGESIIIGGGSNRIAYRFSHKPVVQRFTLFAPHLGDHDRRRPVILNIDSSGKPVELGNPSGERFVTVEKLP